MKIQSHILKAFIRHAKTAAPLEACALLAGHNDEIDTIYLMTNVDASPVHYSLDAKEQFFVVKHVRKQNKKLLGVIHSHPETPARPSEEDKRLAFQPGFFHLIMSLASNRPNTKAFVIENGVSREVRLVETAKKDDYRQIHYPEAVWHAQQQFIDTLVNWQAPDWADVRNKAQRVKMGVYEQRAANTYMVRARIPSGVITHQQLAAVGDAAETYGNGTIHLTTRQSLQIHNIPRENIAPLLRALLDVKVSTLDTGGNSVRNIITCPGAGYCAHQATDVAPIALALGERLMGRRNDVQLPRKFKICFSGCANDCANAKSTDLGFVAQTKKGRGQFEVRAAGGLGSRPSTGMVLEKNADSGDTAKIALALISLFEKKGERKNKRTARLRHLKEKIGEKKLARLYSESLSVFENETQLNISHRTVFDLTGQTPAKEMPHFEQGFEKGTYHLALRPTLGILKGRQTIALAALAREVRATIHLSQLQSVGLHGVKGEYLQTVDTALEVILPNWSSPALQKQPVVCAGTSVCKQGMCNSRSLHTAILAEFAASNVPLPPDWPQIRISGCPNSCAAHQVAPLGLQGGARRIGGKLVPAYDIFFRNADAPPDGAPSLGASIGYLPAQAVPAFMVHLAKMMIMSGLSISAVIEKELASFEKRSVDFENTALYRDVGECTPFSLDDRSRGECSIGIIDIIEADLQAAERSFEEFTSTFQPEKLCDGALAASRALLITRGESCTEGPAVAEAFTRHFIDTGLIDSSYKSLLLSLAHPSHFVSGISSGVFQPPQIQRLIEAVRTLYKRMDAHFNFSASNVQQASPGNTSAQQPVELDLSGVACPMNFVKAKLALEKLPIGATLKVILDDGAPIKNVPASFRSQGQHVTEVKALGNGVNLLVVERAR